VDYIKQKIKNYVYFDAWQRWEYKHTTLLLMGLLLFVLLLNTSIVVATREFIGTLGYLGAFVAGAFSVSFFTAIPAVVLLVGFSDLNIFVTAAIAGFGSMIGDYIILKYAEEKVAYELKPIAFKFGIPQTLAYLQGKRSTLGLVRLVGAIIIASPLPDEIGIGILNLGKLRRPVFLAICYTLNALGILLILLTARAVES